MNRPRSLEDIDVDHATMDETSIASAFFNTSGKISKPISFDYLRRESAWPKQAVAFPGFSRIGEKAEGDQQLMRGVIGAVAPDYATGRRQLTAKRLFDITASIAGLLILAPVFAFVFLMIWLTDSGPAIYAHERVGRNGQLFRCLKFRTMRRDADQALAVLLQSDPEARREWDRAQKLRHDPRISPIGRFLRLSSLDELPQLFNVLAGDMSLVGPRPIILSECHRYGRYLGKYLDLTPGLTGLWQVSGKNSVSYRRRVALDVLYHQQASFRLDLMILLKTIPAIARTEGY